LAVTGLPVAVVPGMGVAPVALSAPLVGVAAAPTVGSFLADLVQAVQQQIVAAILALAWGVLVWPARVLHRRLSPPPLRVYLSATLDDLGPYGAAAITVLDRPRARPRARFFGDLVAGGQPTAGLDVRLSQVRGCDLFIGLYAWRYGPTEVKDGESERKSVTEHELHEARNAHVVRALWKRADDVTWPVRYVDDPRTDVLRLREQVDADPRTRSLPGAPMAFARQVEAVVMARQRALHHQQQLLADLTAPSGLVLAGVMGALTVASHILRDALTHTSSSGSFVVGTALAAFAAAYGVRLMAVRLP
jgi:hypothetical protein